MQQSQRRQRRIEPRPHEICTQNFLKVGLVVPEIMLADRQTDRLTDRNTPLAYRGGVNIITSCVQSVIRSETFKIQIQMVYCSTDAGLQRYCVQLCVPRRSTVGPIDKTRQREVTDAGTTVPLSLHLQCRYSDDNIHFIQLKTLIDLRFRLGSLSNKT